MVDRIHAHLTPHPLTCKVEALHLSKRHLELQNELTPLVN